ncbi:hypothetical protein ACQPU1_13375 [Clostridium paraputrificum]|uniref:hypothetical protein n=1 Tax=Clostridium paraputrificum TaxID=29363 RepID=UPI003D3563C6
MYNNFSIKGLTPKELLLNKSLKNMETQTVNSIITLDKDIDDFFEINILGEITNIKYLPFEDMILNIITCNFDFNIIGIDSNNNGVFFKYSHRSIITIKSYNELSKVELLILEGSFNKISKSTFDYSLIIALDPSKTINNVPITNPLKDINAINSDSKNLFFDKELI